VSDILFDNVILVDYDGVCAYWEHAFVTWMFLNGYGKPKPDEYDLHLKYNITQEMGDLLSKMFNESAALAALPPMKDAIKYIRKLHEEHGYVFHCITAIPDIPASREARWKNIKSLFGDTAFERLILCGESKAKDNILQDYANSGCFWIEDVPKNAEYGLKHGLKPLLFSHHYNADYIHSLIPRVYSWKEIYWYVTGETLHPV
jgi:5'(3')-deoxyribonucleotidase